MGWIPGKQKLNNRLWTQINTKSNENVMDRWMFAEEPEGTTKEESKKTERWYRARMVSAQRVPIHPDDFRCFLQEAHEWDEKQRNKVGV